MKPKTYTNCHALCQRMHVGMDWSGHIHRGQIRRTVNITLSCTTHRMVHHKTIIGAVLRRNKHDRLPILLRVLQAPRVHNTKQMQELRKMTGYESKKAMAQDKITDEQGRPMTYWGGKAQPAQKPVAFISPGGHIHYDPYLDSIPLYTAPSQRPWVGMPEDEKEKFVIAYYPSNWDRKTAVALMNNYEAYLKEKNT